MADHDTRIDNVRIDNVRIDDVRIDPGGYLVIDVGSWVSLRTAGTDPALTDDLRGWAGPRPSQDWPETALAWCRDRGHQVRGPGVIVHAGSRLNAQVRALLADARDGRRIAVVGVNHDPPTVHLDTTTDPWSWSDADSIVIACPGGHSWRWRAGREVVTADGRPTTLTTVFGPTLDAPFSICPDCTAFHLGARTTPCDCDRSPWIVCPTCGRRCGVGLPQP